MGITERREREKLRRRNDILDAAEKVFFEKGYSATKMDDVAEMAELSKGTVYLYFKSKEELYFGLTHRALTYLSDKFKSVIKSKKSGLEKVRDIGTAFFRFSQEQPEYYKTIAQFEMAQLETNEEGEAISRQCHEQGRTVMELVAAAVQQGMADGSIRGGLDPLKTAFLLQGLSNGVIQLMAREGKHIKEFEMFDPEELRQDFMNMMMHALQPD